MIASKLVIESLTKYKVKSVRLLVLVWPPFELLHNALITIMSYVTHLSSRSLNKWIDFILLDQLGEAC